jgi:hypothetical protein
MFFLIFIVGFLSLLHITVYRNQRVTIILKPLVDDLSTVSHHRFVSAC